MAGLATWRQPLADGRPAAELLDLTVTLHVGGGLGDLLHRLVDSEYLRRLPAIKDAFPHLRVVLLIEALNPTVARSLFECHPLIDRIVAVRNGDWHLEDLEQFDRALVRPNLHDHARDFPATDPTTVRARTLRRAYALLRFPRVRALTFDDLFEQLELQIGDFPRADPYVAATVPEIVRATEVEGRVGVHFLGQDGSRAFPRAAWAAAVGAVLDAGRKVVLYGAPAELDPDHPGFPHHEHARDLAGLARDLLARPDVLDYASWDGARVKLHAAQHLAGALAVEGPLMNAAWLYRRPTYTPTERDAAIVDQPNGFYWAYAAGEPFARVQLGPPDPVAVRAWAEALP